jgi:PIN domain nuclease of toxin-antitoxin system
MNLLLDTHVLLWLLLEDNRLTRNTVSAIVDRANTIFISAVTGVEIATKVRVGKLPEAIELSRELTHICSDFDFREVGITMAHAVAAGALPGTHRDPFDRILAAQARIEDITLVTNDAAFKAFNTPVFWSP